MARYATTEQLIICERCDTRCRYDELKGVKFVATRSSLMAMSRAQHNTFTKFKCPKCELTLFEDEERVVGLSRHG